jgi:hypothetical protein
MAGRLLTRPRETARYSVVTTESVNALVAGTEPNAAPKWTGSHRRSSICGAAMATPNNYLNIKRLPAVVVDHQISVELLIGQP